MDDLVAGTRNTFDDADADTYASLAPELMRYATALVGPSDAPDVFSTAVLRVFRSPRWHAVTARKAYLYRAVFNEAQTWNQRVSARRARESRWEAPAHTELPGFDADVVDAVNALSARQRAVIALTYWADLPPDVIAQRLDISEGSVRRHLARARKRLREVLQ
jgi:RNA polymerase sigma-70 factor (ECF subfamily)